MDLRDYTINSAVSKNFKTRGAFVIEPKGYVFNTEIIAALELDNMLEVAEALAMSAAHRRESRGAHTRRDAPKRDDQNFLYHTLCYYGASGPRLGKKAVTLGKWVPEERKY